MPWLSLKSNPLWNFVKPSPWDLMTHSSELQPGTLWQNDADGFKSPTDGRSITTEERAYLDQYNSERKALNEAARKAVDEVIKRVAPLTDCHFKELTDIKFHSLIDDISWLNDHPLGSEFYNDPNNFGHSPDETADLRIGRLSKLLQECGLNVDTSELEDKVSSGMSSPIVINLDGSGITTTSFIAGKTVYFDIDGDGLKERTAWVSGNNAFLAIDANGDGVIKLFGGKNRGKGFAKLAELDSNGDGIIDKNDERFFDLLLWQDKNMDGVMDKEELVPAWKAGLESINLEYTTQDVWENGNLLGEISSAIYQGKKAEVADIYFRYKRNSESNFIEELENEKQSTGSESQKSSEINHATDSNESMSFSPTFIGVPTQ